MGRRHRKDKRKPNEIEKHPTQESVDCSPKQVNTSPLRGLNPKQEQYIRFCRHNPVVIATGFAGTSKTYIPTRIAIEKLQNKEIDKIVIVRPNISGSQTLGFFSGDPVEKLKLWLQPVLDTLNEFLGKEYVDYLIKQDKISCVPLEVIKGRSFKNCFIIYDEAEDLTVKEFIKCVTRQGEKTTSVFCGDVFQTDLKTDSGLVLGMTMAEECPNLNWSSVYFDSKDDIVRSREVKQAIIEFTKRGLM